MITALVLLLIAVPLASAKSKQDRVQIGSGIVVHEGEEVGDIVCVGCGVKVQGTCGDVVAIGGGVVIEGQVRGDVVAVGGGVKLREGAHIAGDVVTVGGGLSRDPGSEVKGEVVSQGGAWMLPLLILVPLIPVILIVALIWWLITRSNRPQAAPVQQTYMQR
jgi:hypothetical protein